MRLGLIVSCIQVFRIVYAISPISGAPLSKMKNKKAENISEINFSRHLSIPHQSGEIPIQTKRCV